MNHVDHTKGRVHKHLPKQGDGELHSGSGSGDGSAEDHSGSEEESGSESAGSEDSEGNPKPKKKKKKNRKKMDSTDVAWLQLKLLSINDAYTEKDCNFVKF